MIQQYNFLKYHILKYDKGNIVEFARVKFCMNRGYTFLTSRHDKVAVIAIVNEIHIQLPGVKNKGRTGDVAVRINKHTDYTPRNHSYASITLIFLSLMYSVRVSLKAMSVKLSHCRRFEASINADVSRLKVL